MTHPPPRKRFQIHLSTSIVMMFVAGGLIWANVTENQRLWDCGEDAYEMDVIQEYKSRGWPDSVFVEFTGKGYYTGEGRFPKGHPYPFAKQSKRERDDTALVINATVASIILFAVWFFCEYLIRRRAARKGA